MKPMHLPPFTSRPSTWLAIAAFLGPQFCSTVAAQEARVIDDVSASRLAVVPGNVHPNARPEYDQGPVDPSLKMSVTLALKESTAQQADLEQLLRQQQDPSSTLFRKWLSPEQYADRFGLNRSDIEKISAWLRSNGFTVAQLARGRDFIAFNGTAAQVEGTLRTPIHRYLVDGREHYGNVFEPSLPEPIAKVARGFLGLDDFRPVHRKYQIRPLRGPQRGAGPNYTDPQSGMSFLAPSDVAAIYDILPLYQNGLDGTGETIVVAGQTNIDLADIRAFRQAFNLPANEPRLILVPGSPEPGILPDQLDEADLDLEWSGAIAPKANVLFVYSQAALLSAVYAIDNALAPVISYSFSNGCEANVMPSLPAIVESAAQKANIEGMTWVASSGDAGAAACENQNGTATQATSGLSVNIPASVPEVTGVGGTEFAEGTGSYWGTNNVSWGSAQGYVPETAWNDSLLIAQGFAASGGGMSVLYSKPWWQNGPGVPNDAQRDAPDVALAASGVHDPYLLCTNGQLEAVGGTSAAAPTFAGMVVLMNQYFGTNGLGNINPNLYALAQAGPSGLFHDIITGSNIVPCQTGTQNCPSSGQMGYSAGPGYDQVTGLGSVDAANLVTNWTALPLLTITSLRSDTTVLTGGTMNIAFTVANNGGANAGAFRIGIYLLTSAISLPGLVPFAYCDISGLAPGATTSCAGTATVSAGTPAGPYYLVAVADILGQLVEYYQARNIRVSDSGPVNISAPCSYSISGSTVQFSANGGSGVIGVQTQAGCPWSVAASVNWITISGTASGTGPGTVPFSVAANYGAARTGALIAANQQLTVSQAAVANITLQFTNYLIYPATVSVNGGIIGTVGASEVASFAVQTPQTLSVSFALVRPTVGSVPIGDPMVGYWNTINNPTGTYTFTITNQIGTQEYFAPLVTNDTGVALLMDVNLGLSSENRCNCVVPVAGTNVGIGYYQFSSTSTVEAFLSTSNYSGQYSYFYNLGASVQSQTGVVQLTFNQRP